MRYVQGTFAQYLGVMAIAFGLAATVFVPAALAATNEYGNVVMPRVYGNTGPMCYVDGAIQSCDGPVPVNMNPPSQVGTVAGSGDSDQPSVLQQINGSGNH